MNDSDYQAIIELKNSHGWKLIREELDIRIKAIEEILLTPTNDDMFNNLNDEKVLNLNNYKKAERIYLLKLKELPQELLETKIKIKKQKS